MLRQLRNNLLCIITVLFLTNYISAQTLLSDVVDPQFSNNNLVFEYGDYKGSPYVNEGWNKVSIHTSVNGIIEAEEANLDIYKHKLIAKKDGKNIWVNDNQINFFLLVDDKGMERRFIKHRVGEKYEYYEVIHDGRINIFRSYSKKFTRPNENSQHNYGGNVSEKPYFSRESVSYYISFDDGELKKSVLSKKAIEKVLPEEYLREYKRWLKKEKVSFKKEEELKSFLERFETELKE